LIHADAVFHRNAVAKVQRHKCIETILKCCFEEFNYNSFE
jgi:hypothetical protein